MDSNFNYSITYIYTPENVCHWKTVCLIKLFYVFQCAAPVPGIETLYFPECEVNLLVFFWASS